MRLSAVESLSVRLRARNIVKFRLNGCTKVDCHGQKGSVLVSEDSQVLPKCAHWVACHSCGARGPCLEACLCEHALTAERLACHAGTHSWGLKIFC